MENYGFLLNKEIAEQSEKDWLLGGEPIKGLAENIETAKYLPQGEVQRTSKSDMMDCATRAPLNILEIKFNYLTENGLLSEDNIDWLKGNGYFNELKGGFELSDAYNAILSGTTTQGNSLKAPLEAIRKYGCVPKRRLPLEPWMNWWDYHNKARITPLIKELGLEFARRFPVNYEKVMKEDFGNVITWDILDIAGYAWSRPVNGIYPRVTHTPNHAFMYFKTPAYIIFDNYVDSYDGDFIKHLASDYNLLHYGYRVIINEAEKKKTMQVDSKQLNTISRELLIEPSSIELEKSYLKDGEPAYEEDFVRNEIMKSKQRQDIESFVKFFKKFGFLKGKE